MGKIYTAFIAGAICDTMGSVGIIMVWIGICYDRMSILTIGQGSMTDQSHVDQPFRPVVLPFAQRVGRNFEFQGDNECPYRAGAAVDILRYQGIPNLPWLSEAPDMSPIEHIRDVFGCTVRNIPLSLHPVATAWAGSAGIMAKNTKEDNPPYGFQYDLEVFCMY